MGLKATSWLRQTAILLRWLIRVPLFLLVLWCTLALWFDFPVIGSFCALLFFFGMVRLFWITKKERTRVAWMITGCSGVILWWILLPPSNDRQWNQTGKVLAVPEIDGDQVTIKNLRNFQHTSPGAFVPQYYDSTFDLKDLQSVDLIFDNFLGEAPVSHTMMSFGFSGDRYICLTIEPRREEGEPYSIPSACFKGFEIIYYLGDERDILFQCTNVLDQDVYLYRLNLTPEERRRLCEGCLRKAAQLAEKPEWYNFLTNNCTNNLLWHGQATRVDWRETSVILNGLGQKLAYERGYLANHLSFDELKSMSRINEKAKQAGYCPDFSRKIREGLVCPVDSFGN